MKPLDESGGGVAPDELNPVAALAVLILMVVIVYPIIYLMIVI